MSNGDNLAAIFDLDGTLIDSQGKVEADVVRAMNHFGITLSEEEKRMKWDDLREKYGIERKAFYEAFGRRKSWSEAILDGEVNLFPDTERTLSSLRQRGVVLGALTRSNLEYTEEKINGLGLDEYFKGRVAVTHVDAASKLPEALGLVREMGKIRRAYFIGDRAEDVEVAEQVQRQLGVSSKGIYLNRGALTLPGYRTVRSLEEILPLIE